MRYLFLIALLIVIPLSVEAQSGCCSWHGGVSHCDSLVGRQVCEDGTYSPSCGCYKETAPIVKSEPAKEKIYLDTSFNNKWCGYGIVFDSSDKAKISLQNAYNDIQKPLADKIYILENENDSVKKGNAILAEENQKNQLKIDWLFWSFAAYILISGYYIITRKRV